MAQLDGLAAMEDLKAALEAALGASEALTTECHELEESLVGFGGALHAAVAEAIPTRVTQCRAAIDSATAELGERAEAAVHDIELFSGELQAADEILAVQLFARLRQELATTGQGRKLADIEAATAYEALQAAVHAVESAVSGGATAIDDARTDAVRCLGELGLSVREDTAALGRAIGGMKSEVQAGQEQFGAYLHDTWCPQLNAAIDTYEGALGKLGADEIQQALDQIAHAALAETGRAIEQALEAVSAAVGQRIGSLLDDLDGGAQQHVLDRDTARQLIRDVEEAYAILDGLFLDVSEIYNMVRHLV